MKKLQCEVCGSTEIKKVSDDLFECQSCGIQYSKNDVQKLLVEITGEVKIDRSAEVENAIKRAEQFAGEGDEKKAAEYYNKALDIDPGNEVALRAVEELEVRLESQRNKAQEEAERNSSAIKLLKHTVQPEEGVAAFLKGLKNASDVAPDIYKELEIMSVTQGYYPFSAVGRQYNGRYEGVACYRKQVPYTDYETRKDYHNKNQDGSYKEIQVAVTKYREEIERKPVNGTFLVDHFGVFSKGRQLNERFTSIAPDKYDEVLLGDKYYDELFDAEMQRAHYNDVVLRQLEKQVEDKYASFKPELTEIFVSVQKSVEGIEIYCDSTDEGWNNRINGAFDIEVRDKARKQVKNTIPGDFSEDVRWNWSLRTNKEQTVYLPVQVIEYAYRGRFYISAMLLVKSCSIIHSYPCNTELKTTESQSEKTVSNVKKTAFPNGALVLYVFGAVPILTLGWLAITGEEIDSTVALAFILISLVFLIPAVLWHVLWNRKKKNRMRTELLEGAAKVDAVKEKFSTELMQEYTAFFKVFTDLSSVEKAVADAAAVSGYSSDISSIKGRTTYAAVRGATLTDRVNATVSASDGSADIQDEVLSQNGCYTVRLIDSGADVIEVCKVIRETCGIGLVAAKELAEAPRSVVANGVHSDKADALAAKLRMAGAIVEIEREM